ncbi:hypothetical protein C8K18_101800 [Paraburkholderia sp. GV068]|uniref:hypothetical protein n=1 Tax=unclassified Paraburkholderia TaxID=2615204 RepID=UPI000D4F1197|nr:MULTISPECIES: hypothetical protein [unclassified Paraburkholderia]PTR04320.1 hypothetical protein C8K19_101725 [Paraburkholderia sp. GV072]PUB09277.1 hypothetical protein C8K18_101800 [Paraburkholderia sp. GV068]
MTQILLRLSQGVLLVSLSLIAPTRPNAGVALCVGLVILFELMAWADRTNRKREREKA